MFFPLAIGSQALEPVHATVFRRFDGYGFRIEVGGIGKRVGGKIVMWDADGKPDSALQSAVDLHISATARRPGQPKAEGKSRFLYFRIYYPQGSGPVNITPDAQGNVQTTQFLSAYSNHMLMEINCDESTKRASAVAHFNRTSTEQSVMPYKVGAETWVGARKVKITKQEHFYRNVWDTKLNRQKNVSDRMTTYFQTEGWGTEDFATVTYLNALKQPIIHEGEAQYSVLDPRKRLDRIPHCAFLGNWEKIAYLAISPMPKVTVRFLDLPLDPR